MAPKRTPSYHCEQAVAVVCAAIVLVGSCRGSDDSAQTDQPELDVSSLPDGLLKVIDCYLTARNMETNAENRRIGMETIDEGIVARHRQIPGERRRRLRELQIELRRARAHRDAQRERELLSEIRRAERENPDLVPRMKPPYRLGEFGTLPNPHLKVVSIDEEQNLVFVREVEEFGVLGDTFAIRGRPDYGEHDRFKYGCHVVVAGFVDPRRRIPILAEFTLSGTYLDYWQREHLDDTEFSNEPKP